MKSSDIKTIFAAHKDYWDNKQIEMRAYTNAYNKKMFSQSQASQLTTGDNDVIVETSDGFAIIESYISSLFPKQPSVIVSQDATGEGNEKSAQAIINRYLFDKFALIEQGLRYSLIYPFAGWKMGVCNRARIIDSVEVKPILPWDMIIDQNATRWENQRFVGHRYFLPLAEAKDKFGNKEFVGADKVDYLETGSRSNTSKSSYSTDSYKLATQNVKKTGTQSTLLTYVEIIEMYDFQNDILVFYSPSLKSSDGVLDQVSPIPFRDGDDSPISPIVPMFLGTDPQVPLGGNSTMARIYSQLWEINSQRTAMARFVRRDTRLYLSRKGSLDEEAKAAMSQNIDNSVIEIDCPPDVAVSTIIQPFQNQPISPEFFRYNELVRRDLDSGGILAPFSRGAPTNNASATEISALTLYAQTEIGRLARFRDEAIERLAAMYLMFIRILLETQPATAEKEVIVIDGEKYVLVPEDFQASFKIVSIDQGSTPISAAAKRQRLVELTPLLINLGIERTVLLEQIVREFELPPSLLESIKGQEATAGLPGTIPPGSEEQPASEQTAVPVGGGTLAQEIRNTGGLV